MKERNMKKAFTILFQIASIILLSLFFVTSFFVFLGKPNKLTNTDAVYTYTSLPLIVNTTQVQKANIIKTIRLYGEVKREIDNFAQISVPKPVELACAIGSIINNASDISGNNTENNFAVGRVAEIEENATEHIVKIDLASNYVVVLTIADSYSTYIGDIVSGELNVEIQNNYRLLNVDFLRLDYDKTTTRFLFFYRLTQLDNYTFPNMGISAKIIEKEYKNAVCLDISALRNLTEDYKAVVDRVVSTDNNVLRLEELQFEIIDVANDKIIIDAGSYLGSSFLVYDIYHAVPIK